MWKHFPIVLVSMETKYPTSDRLLGLANLCTTRSRQWIFHLRRIHVTGVQHSLPQRHTFTGHARAVRFHPLTCFLPATVHEFLYAEHFFVAEISSTTLKSFPNFTHGRKERSSENSVSLQKWEFHNLRFEERKPQLLRRISLLQFPQLRSNVEVKLKPKDQFTCLPSATQLFHPLPSHLRKSSTRFLHFALRSSVPSAIDPRVNRLCMKPGCSCPERLVLGT